MEDPWANAWGDSSKTNLPDTVIATNTASWSAPSISAIHGDNEDDLSATPSWSAPSTSLWESDVVAGTALWGADTSTAWNPAPSTFDRISLSNHDSVSEPDLATPTYPSQNSDETLSSSPESPSKDESPKDIISVSRDSLDSPRSTSSSPPQSTSIDPPARSPVLAPLSLDAEELDGFGTFETAVEDLESTGWSPSKPAFSIPSADATAWGAAWDDPGSPLEEPISTKSTEEDMNDAWERARQEKAQQDLYVPPELLTSILHNFDELSSDLWGGSEGVSSGAVDVKESIDLEQLGLTPVSQRLIPNDLTLPTNVPFAKTFTGKQMSDSLKHTRHSPLTRMSPMAFYVSSKGLTSWEASVKAKPASIPDDVTPSGWKIVENTKEETPEENKKKPSGGLFSFFGRKATNSPVASNPKRTSSPVPTLSSLKTTASPRASSDVHTTATPSPILPQADNTSSAQISSLDLSETKSSSSNYATASPSPLSPPVPESEPVAPTAVSRFLGRFSRSRNSSSHESLSLSVDDLEFLSDVPTFDPDTHTDSGLDALSTKIKAPASIPLPPPLKPPSGLSSISNSSSKTVKNPDDEFMSFFDTPTNTSRTSASPLTSLSAPPANKPSTTQVISSTTAVIANTFDQLGQPANEDAWPSFDYPSTAMKKTSTTTTTKRSFVPIMVSSSSKASSSNLPIPSFVSSIPPPPLLPPPPPSNRPLTNSTGSTVSQSYGIPSSHPLPPPSRSFTPQPPSKPKSSQIITIDEDDEFSDFLSSPPSQVAQSSETSFGAFASGPSHGPHPTATPSNLFNDFDDFASPPPPQPPAKGPNYTIPTPFKATPNGSAGESRANTPLKSSRVADHSRTLSLMENVASRGRWLGPPSPLPEAFPPPPESGRQSTTLDIFSGSSMQEQQARAVASLAGSSSTFLSKPNGTQFGNGSSLNLPPPPSMNPMSVASSTMRPSPPPILPAPVSTEPRKSSTLSSIKPNEVPSPLTTTKTGGLSAQDLSFFEGL